MNKPIPTEAQIDAAWDEANRLIDTLTMVPEFIIEDYPIGGKDGRGRCRLAVDFKRGRGWRTNKTTTDKTGRWCKPKGSVYQDSPIVVVTGVPWKDSTTAAWLKMDQRIGPYLQMANWDNRMLCEPPCYFRPSRCDTGYSVRVNDDEPEQKVIKGDSPLLCDAWERWFDEYKRLVQKVMAFIEGKKT